MALRARLVLAFEAVGEDGFPVSVRTVAEAARVSREIAAKWRRWFLADRPAGLSDEPASHGS